MAKWRARTLWVDPQAADAADASLAGTQGLVDALASRIDATRAGFAALPRLERDDAAEPEPVAHDPLPAA